MFGFLKNTNWERLAAKILIIFFSLATVVLVGSLALKVHEVFTLFFVALLFKYLIDKPVKYLTKITKFKTISVFIIFSLILLFIFMIGNHSFPIISKQVVYLKKALPSLINASDETKTIELEETGTTKLSLPEGIERVIRKLDSHTLEEYLQSLSENLAYKDFRVFIATTLFKSVNLFASTLIVFVICFYLTVDGIKLWSSFELIFPKNTRKHLNKIKLKIHHSLEAFIQGQFQIAVLSSVVMFLTYLAISAKYPIILAVLQLLEFIPVLGTWIAIVPALLVVYLTSGTVKALIALSVYLIYSQIIRDILIAPQVYGSAFKMHPICIVIAIIIGAKLAGITGVFLSFPFIAISSGIVNYIIEYNENQ